MSNKLSERIARELDKACCLNYDADNSQAYKDEMIVEVAAIIAPYLAPQPAQPREVWQPDHRIVSLEGLLNLQKTPWEECGHEFITGLAERQDGGAGNVANVESDLWKLNGKHVRVTIEWSDAPLPAPPVAVEPPRCPKCGHDYVAPSTEGYDCRVIPYENIGDPVICGCDDDFHSTPATLRPSDEAAHELLQLNEPKAILLTHAERQQLMARLGGDSEEQR